MKKSLIFLSSIFIVINIVCTNIVWAWDDSITHKDLTELAAKQSILGTSDGFFLQLLGFPKDIDEVLLLNDHVCDDDTRKNNCTIKEWLRYGAEKEDNWKIITSDPSLRMLNHFHEPIRGRGLYGPLLDDFNYLFNTQISPQSSLEWAQDANNQTSEPLEGDQSWITLRGLYYIALTHTNEDIRKETFAQLFKGLGHQMHLVQDMAVPTHTRNDAHLLDPLVGKHEPWWRADSPRFFES